MSLLRRIPFDLVDADMVCAEEEDPAHPGSMVETPIGFLKVPWGVDEEGNTIPGMLRTKEGKNVEGGLYPMWGERRHV